METSNENTKHINSLIEPWTKAVKSWIDESDKIQQAAMDGWTKAVDNSHKLAKDGLVLATNLGNIVHKQVQTQIERALKLVNSSKA